MPKQMKYDIILLNNDKTKVSEIPLSDVVITEASRFHTNYVRAGKVKDNDLKIVTSGSYSVGQEYP